MIFFLEISNAASLLRFNCSKKLASDVLGLYKTPSIRFVFVQERDFSDFFSFDLNVCRRFASILHTLAYVSLNVV